MVETGQFTTKV